MSENNRDQESVLKLLGQLIWSFYDKVLIWYISNHIAENIISSNRPTHERDIFRRLKDFPMVSDRVITLALKRLIRCKLANRWVDGDDESSATWLRLVQ